MAISNLNNLRDKGIYMDSNVHDQVERANDYIENQSGNIISRTNNYDFSDPFLILRNQRNLE